MPLKITSEEKKPGAVVVKLAGRLDTTTSEACEAKLRSLIKEGARILTLDMEKLEYISSMGLRIILSVRKTLEENKGRGRIVLVKLQPQIAKVFELADVLPKTSIFDSTESADIFLDAIQNKELNKDKDFLD